MDTGCFHLLAVVNPAAVNMHVQVSVWMWAFTFSGQIPKSGGELRGQMVTSCDIYPSSLEPSQTSQSNLRYLLLVLSWSDRDCSVRGTNKTVSVFCPTDSESFCALGRLCGAWGPGHGVFREQIQS